MTPASLPSIATKIAVAPSLAQAFRLPVERAGRDAELGQERRIADHHAPAFDHADRALAGRRSRIRGHLRSRFRARAAAATIAVGERMFARSLDACSEAQDLAFDESRRRHDCDHVRLAFGERAGLVDHQRVTFSMRSSAWASLISTPACAPRPTPTMIDMGVASPSAQGHAMMSTLTAATRA